MGDVLRFPTRVAPPERLSSAHSLGPPALGFIGVRHGSVRMALGDVECSFSPGQARYLASLLLELASEAEGPPP